MEASKIRVATWEVASAPSDLSIELQLDAWEFDAGPVPFDQARGCGTMRRTLVKQL